MNECVKSEKETEECTVCENCNSAEGISGFTLTPNMIKGIVSIIALLVLVIVLISNCFNNYEDKYKKQAIGDSKSFATEDFREKLGVAPDELKTKVIYNETDYADNVITLVEVNCYIEGEVFASYCVYCMNGTALNSTIPKDGEYDYKEKLNDIKALFGIVD